MLLLACYFRANVDSIACGFCRKGVYFGPTELNCQQMFLFEIESQASGQAGPTFSLQNTDTDRPILPPGTPIRKLFHRFLTKKNF